MVYHPLIGRYTLKSKVILRNYGEISEMSKGFAQFLKIILVNNKF
ncbi:hypothetical protein UNSWDHB_806 [Dehalobacter sp. UNSWDHB]|nr:hypothetical protein UNSWDHB_806 [Dehalobacter sp. UNSWDHB]